MLFHATTISSGAEHAVEVMLRRDRILDQLDRHPTTGVIAWIVGPIGSGKSTIAVQWASALGKPVQYVSAKPHPFSGELKSEPSDEFGKALEDLLNACSDTSKAPSVEEISACLKIVVELSKSEPRVFILDDMEMIRRSAMLILQELLIEALPELKVDRALVISRTIDSNVLSGLQALRSLRMILPPTLAFDRDEAAEAQRIGVFGTATPEQVEEARIQSDGWITGMLTSLGGHGGQTISQAQLHNDVLNNLLMHQPPPILQVMMASARLPWNHVQIWERWFDHLGIPLMLVPSTISQLPVSNGTNDNDIFSIAPTLRSSLRDLSRIAVSEAAINELLTIAIAWFVEKEEHSIAANLADEHDLRADLMKAINDLCAQYAEDEHWGKVLQTLEWVSENHLLEEPALAFWYLHGLVETEQWPEMKRVFNRLEHSWRSSTDPLVMGRSLLVQAWNAYMLNSGEEAFLASEAAYNMLPEAAHRERFWAAGTASIAQSFRGYPNGARMWSAQSNYERGFLVNSSHWWHHNAGPLRYSWLAITGMLDEAYELAARQVRRLGATDNPDRARYLILMAQIETERLRFESAEMLLSDAKMIMREQYGQEHHYRVAHTNWLRAKGDFQSAAEILAKAQVPENQRLDQFSRELHARARIALDMTDVEGAELFLSGSPSSDLAWPKIFGDAHPGLVRARLRHLLGRHDDAIAMAQAVATEAGDRHHVQWVIAANALLASIFHALNREKARDRAISIALAANGDSGFQLSFIVDGQDIRDLAAPEVMDHEVDLPRTLTATVTSSVDQLTTRELEVLSLVGGGLSNKQIADRMYISISTVKNHLASAYTKLGTNNRRGATKIARDLGLINS